MFYLFYVFFAVLPSAVWLSYFLRRDVHPEPNKEILKIFFWGAAVSLPALIIELGVSEILERLTLPLLFSSMLGVFLGVALIEEFLKYLVVKEKVLRSPDFDEPIDAMLYMIIAALGFAAVENILLFFKPGIFENLFDPIKLSITRFLSATFLHALASATIGFFLAFSLLKRKNHLVLLTIGFVIAILLHGLYNFSIMNIDENLKSLQIVKRTIENTEGSVPASLVSMKVSLENNIFIAFLFVVTILASLALFVSIGLKKLKRLKSICIQYNKS